MDDLSILDTHHLKNKTKIVTKIGKSIVVPPDQVNKRILHVLGTSRPGAFKVYLPPTGATANFDKIKKDVTFYDFLSSKHTTLAFFTEAGCVYQHSAPEMLVRWYVENNKLVCTSIRAEESDYSPVEDEEVMEAEHEIVRV